MKPEQLICECCLGALTAKTEELPESPELSWLVCDACERYTPVINGFPLFSETVQSSAALPAPLLNLFKENPTSYPRYMQQKQDRNILEVYAALQPFNESTRALFPLLAALQEKLQPGDVIIDTWARTGWHALLLSALFPEQRVIAIWDTNTSVLGYAGYDWWLSEPERPKNLEVMFVSKGSRLPFDANSISLVFAHDVLHRYDFPDYPEDIERVCADNGIIMFAHVHLSNAEPEPFFKRGGTLRHSDFYREYFDQRLADTERSAYVLSEEALFNLENGSLTEALDDHHYNGVVLIAEKTWLTQTFVANDGAWVSEHSRLLLNPILTFDPLSMTMALNQYGLTGQANYYLDRHPCLKSRLQQVVGQQIDSAQIDLILASEKAQNLGDIAVQLGLPLAKVIAMTTQLQQQDYLLALPVCQQAIALQAFHSNGHRLCDPVFPRYWQHAETATPDTTLELQEQPLNRSDMTEFIQAIATYLSKCGFSEGDEVHVSKELSKTPRLLLMFAAWWLGLIPVFDEDYLADSLNNNEDPMLLDQSHHSTTASFWDVIEKFIGRPPLAATDAGDNQAKRKSTLIPWYQAVLEH
ncbi:Uncharacterised protein [BD1-7 clade bacterium]|uniref:Uncharacterized protein n=1 Tax=BD1-7 clade bacterium TaxID=2029982 RepID=A0A5S9PEL3_9GAMM|nr:Uncharacterised protein [BD1-7 clade bacterium]